MQQHVRSAIDGSLQGDQLFGDDNPPEPLNSRVDYFCLNDSTATIRLAKATIIISVSKTVNQHPPLSMGASQPPLRNPILLLL